MQLKGLKSNQLGKLPAVKNEIHKKGNPKSAIIILFFLLQSHKPHLEKSLNYNIHLK